MISLGNRTNKERKKKYFVVLSKFLHDESIQAELGLIISHEILSP